MSRKKNKKEKCMDSTQRRDSKSVRRQDDNRVLLQVRLKPELAGRIKARAAEECMPMSTWVRHLVVVALGRPVNPPTN
jgi:predicted DNA binding CopG/RHH family protein